MKEFKDAKLADTEGDLAKAEHLLKRFKAKESKKCFEDVQWFAIIPKLT